MAVPQVYRENILSGFPQVHQRPIPAISLGPTKDTIMHRMVGAEIALNINNNVCLVARYQIILWSAIVFSFPIFMRLTF